MCKNVRREGTASLVVIPALVENISQENERGGGARNSPPVERGLIRAQLGGGKHPPLSFFRDG